MVINNFSYVTWLFQCQHNFRNQQTTLTFHRVASESVTSIESFIVRNIFIWPEFSSVSR